MGKHGAVVVIIPRKYTPHGAWRNAQRRFGPKEGESESQRFAAQLRHIRQKVPSDQRIIQHFTESGFHVPVVNFHSTFRFAPEEDRNSGGDLGFFRSNNIPLHPYFEKAIPSIPLHPNELLVAYMYTHGEEPKYKPIFTNTYRNRMTAIRGKKIRINRIDVICNPIKGPSQMHGDYLSDKLLTSKSIDAFSKKHAEDFARVLKYLSQEGLRKVTPTPNANEKKAT